MTIKNTYLFYDIETTGLNPCFDQILQFAAIRTDLELQELERHEIFVRLNCDVIPSPQAIITHHIGIAQSQSGQAEIDAITQIHGLVNTPGTISVGYNSLGFDDDFLRFSFYRNLLPPYTHQHANRCGRMDLYPFTAMYCLYKPNILTQWPRTNQQINLKLEQLNALNQLASGNAHNALVDVEATLALARKFIQDRNMWDYLIGYFDKDSDAHRMAQLTTCCINQQLFQEALMINGKFGSSYHYQAPVLYLGQHLHYKNQSLWLRLDTENLSLTTTENIPPTTYVIRKKMGEGELLLPFATRFLTYIDSERFQLTKENKLWLEQNPAVFQAIRDYHRQYTYPKIPNLDIDASLYDISFPSMGEEMLFKQFHQTQPPQKMALASRFPSPIRQQHALRIMGRHYREYLTPKEQDLFNDYLNHTTDLMDYRGQPKLTRANALNEIDVLESMPQLSAEQKRLLIELKSYLS